MNKLDICLGFTLDEEGGFVDDVRDPGGATNMGVTLTTYRTWSGNPEAEASELRALPRSVATCIYGADYWNRLRGDALPPGLDLLVFDFAVTCGTVRSARELQASLALSPAEIDGSIGPQTLGLSRRAHLQTLITSLTERQKAFYRSLAGFAVFGIGWLSRTERRYQRATLLAAGARRDPESKIS